MNNKEPSSHNFWSGFSVGVLAGGALMYAFATKRGRKLLHTLLESSSTLENNLEGIIESLHKNILNNEDTEEKKKKNN